jgi:hypothetical protein
MPTTNLQQLKQYARVARTLPKMITNGTNARIGALVAKKT